MTVKKLLILFVGYILSSLLAHAEGFPGGLSFTSSRDKVDRRTSLVIFSDKIQKFEDTFHISFDLSIWDSSQFGHIFHLINERKQEVEFVFVNFYGTDSMYLDFHSPITHSSVQIPITQENIDNKTTLHFNIKFDLKTDKATIVLGDKDYICQPVGLKNPSKLQLAFGLYGLNLDVPQMMIKNLQIQQEKGKTFFFPLNESEGEYAYDKTGKIKAPVKNPEWIVNKHFYWQPKIRFTVKDKAVVAYDDANNCILVAGNDSVLCFYPRYDIIQRNKLDSGFVFTENCGESNLLHNNIFFSQSGDIYRFGGYSNHSYSNKISLFNVETGKWETIAFEGDYITPRFYSAVGDGVGNDEILLFGGFGNETGKQEHGGHNLYDLYVLNLKHKTITRLWNMNETPEMEFIPGNNLILNEDQKYFYALCYSHHIPKTVGYLYRFDLQNGAYDIISDSISFTSEDMNTSVNLFYNSHINEFYAVIQDLSDKNENCVQIYSLFSPPITKTRLEIFVHSQRSYGWIFVPVFIIIILLAGICVIWFFFYRKKKNTGNRELIEILHSPYKNELERKQKQSAVYIFGKFMVYDRKGIDISYRFSMKLRALFSLVLLNTERETGITTESLTLSLWPDKDVNGGKNIRGVTINRLRGILEDIDGISLVHQNHQWFFVFEEKFYCDWLEYSGILQSLYENVELKQYNALMEQLIAVVSNGLFLANVQDKGIDDYKSDEKEKLGQLLRDYIIRQYEDKQYHKVILTAPAFFSVEPLNEKILYICIKSYGKLGINEDAKALLKNYKRTHKILTGEEYKGNL